MADSSNEPITLQTVAEAAGVSVSTASRALAGKAKAYRISEKTERNVREIAERLGFRPSQVARSLRSRRTGLLGVVVPDVSNPFFSAIAREVTIEAESKGYSVLLTDSRETTSVEKRMIGQLLDRQVEALVVCPVGKEFDHLERVHQSGPPLVVVDRGKLQSEMTQVMSDHRDGARQAAQLLIRQGHRKIGVLQGIPGTMSNEQRITGLREALKELGIDLDDELVAGDNFTQDSGYESAKQLLSNRPDITAFFALSTPNAMGALRAARELDREVPADLSIVTFDESPFADFMKVPLSTASQDVQQLGRIAATLVTEQLVSGEKPPTNEHYVGMQIIERSSVKEVLAS